MGCHTWFYVHLEQKQKELKEEYFNRIVDGARLLLKLYKETTEEEWKKDFASYEKDDNRTYWKDKTYPECKSLPELKGWSDKSILGEIKLAQTKTWQEYKDFFLGLNSLLVESLETNCHCLEDVAKLLPEQLHGVTGFKYKNGKVYIDASSEIADKYLSRRICDIFRIHDYSTKPCYSVEDCVQRCKEHNVILKDEEFQELEKWYQEYPDTMITFG